MISLNQVSHDNRPPAGVATELHLSSACPSVLSGHLHPPSTQTKSGRAGRSQFSSRWEDQQEALQATHRQARETGHQRNLGRLGYPYTLWQENRGT